MKKRSKMPRKKSKKLFNRTAGSNRVHPKNSIHVMRGGIRF